MRLFEPLKINSMVLPNRVMVPAMVTHLCTEDGFVNEHVIERYARYAQGGTGLIVVEAMAIHQNKSGALLRICDDKFVPDLRRLVDRVHDTSDSKIVPQIIHFMKVARSGWRQTIDQLSIEDIDVIVEQFGNAAMRAREAGFDGIELHSAHAYTLSSFLSRRNPRTDAYGGDTFEGRLRLIGRVMDRVRNEVGAGFPVGVRFNAEEFIKDGYGIEESRLIARRLADLGVDYLSLSAGGKFEDAVHVPGQVLFPYSGYSGDRCMPGDWFPRALHADLAAQIKAYLTANGYSIPVAIAGKLSDPLDAERVLTDGYTDIVGIARGLLADPDWANKVRRGEFDRIVQCDYCNICKQLDGTHKPVVCGGLWPQGALQAPKDDPAAKPPQWDEAGAELTATVRGSKVALRWRKAPGAANYNIYRTDNDGTVRILDAVKATNWADSSVLAGWPYRYHVRACSPTGQASGSSNTAVIQIERPDYMATVR
jgi:2,4-dienoyl-CoA reductase-like NADH-dependent reductase (Old Yellow Enzyme family)